MCSEARRPPADLAAHSARRRSGRALRPTARSLPEHARGHNRSLVLQTLYRSGTRSRADIARETGLTRVTISDLVAELIDRGPRRRARASATVRARPASRPRCSTSTAPPTRSSASTSATTRSSAAPCSTSTAPSSSAPRCRSTARPATRRPRRSSRSPSSSCSRSPPRPSSASASARPVSST